MDNDTLSSIAVKFETTPAELARLNKKPLGVNSTIFTGEVSVHSVVFFAWVGACALLAHKDSLQNN